MTVPIVLGAVLAFFLTGQHGVNMRWRIIGHILYALPWAFFFYRLITPKTGCDFGCLLTPFVIPSWLLSILLCHFMGKAYRKWRAKKITP